MAFSFKVLWKTIDLVQYHGMIEVLLLVDELDVEIELISVLCQNFLF